MSGINSKVSAYNVGSSRNYYSNHRRKLNDLYKSERYFLEPALKKISSVLDVGCAAGGGLLFCKEANNQIEYTGIDVSRELINEAKKYVANDSFYLYNGKIIPFKGKKFDLVFSLGVLHQILDYKDIIKQMVAYAKEYIIFDLRLTKQKTLCDPNKYYQYLQFSKEDSSNVSVPYIVINQNECISFLRNNFSDCKIDAYGYYSKLSFSTNIPYTEILMVSFKITKGSESPGVFFENF